MTIFALSSGPGRAGVSVIRVSGDRAGLAFQKLACKDELPTPREAHLCWFYDQENNSRLDKGLCLWFPAPHSFTGEDVMEFHIHGGRAVVAGFLSSLSKIDGLRLAEPGEFTRRAFDNGKMDLTEAEGLADLINAETANQRRQALRQMDGRLKDLYENWRTEIIKSMAFLETDIDFADEEIPDDVTDQVRPIIEDLHVKISDHLNDNHRGERLRDGLQVVILGEPNAGKSTLMNFLSQRDVAIVSDVAGTTRDMLEVHLDIARFPVTIVDTAGLRETGDVIETEGVRRAEARAENADLKIILCDARDWPTIPSRLMNQIDENSIVLINKSDLNEVADEENALKISALNGSGLDQFMKRLESEVQARMDFVEAPTLTRNRHRQYLTNCQDHLNRFLAATDSELELLAEDLRMAARELGRITGRVDVEDILDVIFTEFCIGK